MKKLIIFMSMILCAATAFTAHAGSAIYKNNVQTASHIAIPGTHVSLVPPRGAELSATFQGFDLSANNIRVQVSESSGSFSQTEGTLTPEGTRALGINFVDSSPVNLNSSRAVLVSGTSASNDAQGVYMLVLGNDSMTVYIYGFYPASDKSADTAVKNSLLSCIFAASNAGNVSGGYTISTNGTSFKLVDEVSSTRYFTVDGKPHGDTIDQALYTSMMSNEGVMPQGRSDYASAAIGKFLSGYEYTVVSSRAVNYGGLPGIEMMAEFDGPIKISRTASGATVRRPVKSKGYQVLLFDDDEGNVFIFGGVAINDADNYVSQFVRMTSSFSRAR